VSERSRTFECFGGRVAVHAAPRGGDPREAEVALFLAAGRLLRIHHRLTRFSPGSELSRLNADPRSEVPASDLLLKLAAAVRPAGEESGGLVDATCLDALEEAGYRHSMEQRPPAERAAADVRRARPALPDPAACWRLVDVDERRRTVRRPPGLRIDSGGLAKGLAADLVARSLAGRATFAVDCAGDLRIGGTARLPRAIDVRDPWGGEPVHRLLVTGGAIATSGITARAWRDPDGHPRHHLIDPGRGRPAWTGVVQATALAPTALLAEVRAKSALLAGPDAAGGHLPDGGVIVLGSGEVVALGAAREPAVAA
jgi:thiamine biosynthesis lipoprotein